MKFFNKIKCELFHEKVTESIYYKGTIPIRTEEYCPICQPNRKDALANERLRWKEVEEDELKYRVSHPNMPYLFISPNEH